MIHEYFDMVTVSVADESMLTRLWYGLYAFDDKIRKKKMNFTDSGAQINPRPQWGDKQ
jgi:hypothetical protein